MMKFFGDNVVDADSLSPLTLAFVGDAVFDVFARTYLAKPSSSVNTLHKTAASRVSAKGQSDAVLYIYDMLSEDERRIYKRGRNAKSATVPKNADVTDYRRATGLEALIGYKYLADDFERLNEILNLCVKSWERND